MIKLVYMRQSKIIWDKVFRSGLSKLCGRPLLKNFMRYGLLKQTIYFLKAVFQKIYLVRS